MKWILPGLLIRPAALAVVLWPAGLPGAVVTFDGRDSGVGPGGTRPYVQGDPLNQSDAAARAFDAAAGAFPLQVFTLETATVGATPDRIAVAPGVMATLIGTSNTPPPGFTYGLSADAGSLSLGFNVTPGGSRRISFAPSSQASEASLRLEFAEPIQGFGAYLTGLSTANGDLVVSFDDGTARELTVAGIDSGQGVQFFGFVSPGTEITRVTLTRRGPFATNRDIFGIDDLRVIGSAVPEPAGAMLLGLGMTAMMGAVAARRRLARLERGRGIEPGPPPR